RGKSSTSLWVRKRISCQTLPSSQLYHRIYSEKSSAVKHPEGFFKEPMRILILADIHANWPALHAVTEPHDICLFVGDLVDYALEPAPCIDWVRNHAHYSVRGNHDHGMAQNVVISGRNGFKYLTGVTRALVRPRLSADDLRFLSRLPVSRSVTIEETRFLLV